LRFFFTFAPISLGWFVAVACAVVLEVLAAAFARRFFDHHGTLHDADSNEKGITRWLTQ
jgi:hypothetical protein